MYGCKVQSAPATTVSCISSLHAYSYIQQSSRSVKTMNAKNTQKSPIHENANANITCDFGDGDIIRFRSRLPHTRTHGHTHGHTVSSIIVRYCLYTTFVTGLRAKERINVQKKLAPNRVVLSLTIIYCIDKTL